MSCGRLKPRLLNSHLVKLRIYGRNTSGTGQTAGRGLKKMLLYTTSTAAIGLAGTAAYAHFDPHFRKSVETNVPGASYIFSNLLGSTNDTPSLSTPKRNNPSDGKRTPEHASAFPVSSEAPSKEKIGDLKSKSLKDEDELAKLIEEVLDKKLSLLTSVQKADLTQKVQLARSEFEEELKNELAKQNSTHALHEEQMLRSQRENLLVEHKKEIQEALLKERREYMQKLSLAIAQLTALQVFLNGRAEFDGQNRRAKKLWIGCQNLKNLLTKKRSIGDKPANRFVPMPLADVISDIKQASDSDEFIQLLLSSLPDHVIHSGVYSEDDLINRYEKVKLLCKRLARVGDGDSSLFQYLLSYLQSLFIWDTVKDTCASTQIDPKAISVYEILSRTSYCMKNKDYTSVIRLMSVLKGEPAKVASDWLKDLRTYVEMVQLADLMTAHASAQSIRSLY